MPCSVSAPMRMRRSWPSSTSMVMPRAKKSTVRSRSPWVKKILFFGPVVPEERLAPVLDALGISRLSLHPGCPVQVLSKANSRLLIGVQSPEALASLMAVGEKRRAEYEPAIEVVRSAADPQMRWTMRTSFNGKMIGDVEKKGRPSKWLTLRALQVLEWFGG